MAPTQLSIVLERLLNELGIANLSMFEAVLMHDTGAVLDAIRSTAAAAEAGAAVYASSATSNVVVCRSSTATAGAISVQHEGSISRTLVSTDAQTTLKASDIHAAASSATAEMLLRQELEEKLRSQTKELASEQRSANAMKKALASARDELAAAQELRRSDCDNLRTATSKRLSGWPTRQIMQLELSISMEAEARRADAAEAERSRLYDKMEGIMRTREGLIDALAEAQRKREQVIVKRYT
ncbi:hypothetical protein EMIHUDRAFT_232615 [Emiliania huxleyi CCMP1516]|uniref:Uncharacterized protein n=2 Tax=Emiliania huxleyi TaxID=2903 RepID=A0A0D3K4E3_EMIH1|nr:hypothetical protein EMIHUDRAFT_215361 [Emiliania huxleyi CCMP1516]XP_005783057.1 hypothetical protein EMIHUDRAFT_232615 [Emiliania huxleyi CCMP1516]EOD10626.1 hypothetical protein EMIHUDRAFT_215361 [Emiliania huxleyi CCMP1516]EOD30628.1 hypothetical protein EMIHUDRAFT_232615 [Emiliania huxleyi CCMP1516]|eukprot:XP_005763055.1 hypothetical protein EMIHUDRAFT_215361 [Emiliania huxleyi CCMP1516]